MLHLCTRTREIVTVATISGTGWPVEELIHCATTPKSAVRGAVDDYNDFAAELRTNTQWTAKLVVMIVIVNRSLLAWMVECRAG